MDLYTVVAGTLAAVLGLAANCAAAACKGTTQLELNDCADFRRADAAMNAAYTKLLKLIGPRAQQGLREAQRAWLPYRDKSCDLEALAVEGGSIQPPSTAERTKMLTGYLTSGDGDTNYVGGIDR